MALALPESWYGMDFVRSYLVQGNKGALKRVELRKCPQTGLTVQATFGVPAAPKRLPNPLLTHKPEGRSPS